MRKVMKGLKLLMFSFLNQEGELINIVEYIGKFLVIYFYLKDDISGCMMEVCGFRDQYEDFVFVGVIVFGISIDLVEFYCRFKSRYNLFFDLFLDSDGKVVRLFGVFIGFF